MLGEIAFDAIMSSLSIIHVPQVTSKKLSFFFCDVKFGNIIVLPLCHVFLLVNICLYHVCEYSV